MTDMTEWSPSANRGRGEHRPTGAEGTKWQEIARDLRDRMLDTQREDHLRPGDQLPSVNVLANERQMAPSTVRRAYEELLREGLISKTGKTERYRIVERRIVPRPYVLVINLSREEWVGPDGMSDTNQPGELDAYRTAVVKQGLVPIVEGPEVSMAIPSESDMGDLGLADSEELVRRAVKRFFARKPSADTEPADVATEGAPEPYDRRSIQPGSLQRAFYPDSIADVAPRLHSVKDISEGTVKYLATQGIAQQGYRDVVISRNATRDEAAFFEMRDLEPVLEVRRISYASDGRALRLTQTIFDATRHRISFETGQVPAD